MGAPLKILYVAGLSPRDSSQYRAWALEREGHTVVDLDFYPYESSQRIVRALQHRVQVGGAVARFNRDILAAAEREKPDVMWADKMLWLRPKTLDRLRAMGIVTVSYMIDNPFGTRQDPGWRTYMRDIPYFDVHVVQRDKNFADYKCRGARDVVKVQTAYEPTLQFPPPMGWGEADRTRGVSFIGTAYDDRPAVLTRLWRERGFPVVIDGDKQWLQKLDAEAARALYSGRELYLADYREAVWRSKINLSFITHANQDEFVHKSFEIAGCGSFLLAERSAGHVARFVEDEEAVFFSGFDELAAKIARYLPDVEARERIARAGALRARHDGYHNDAQVARIVEHIRPLVTKMQQGTR